MGVAVQRMDDSFRYYRAQIDMEASTLTQPTTTRLLPDGTLDGHLMHIETSLLDHHELPPLTRGFHWIQDYPFNR